MSLSIKDVQFWCDFRSERDESTAVWHGAAAVVYRHGHRHCRRCSLVCTVCLQSVVVPAATATSQISSLQRSRLRYASVVLPLFMWKITVIVHCVWMTSGPQNKLLNLSFLSKI